MRPGASRTGGPGEKTQDNADTALIRLFTSNKDSRTRRGRDACDCQERIRQLVVFTPGSSHLTNLWADLDLSLGRDSRVWKSQKVHITASVCA